jgi:hypothetical protein
MLIFEPKNLNQLTINIVTDLSQLIIVSQYSEGERIQGPLRDKTPEG